MSARLSWEIVRALCLLVSPAWMQIADGRGTPKTTEHMAGSRGYASGSRIPPSDYLVGCGMYLTFILLIVPLNLNGAFSR